MTSLSFIADRVLNRPLLIHPDKLGVISSVLAGRIGLDATAVNVDAEMHAYRPEASRFTADAASGRKPFRQTDAGVAVIPVIGSLVNRGAWLGASSGMTSYEGLKHQLAAAASDPSIKSIMLDLDSPGGEAVGAFEVGDAVRAAAGVKPVVAVVNGMAASAAYAIAAGATRIISTPSGMSGSIGVVMLHADYSHRLHEAGVVPTIIKSSAKKAVGSPYKPLTEGDKAHLQSEVDQFFDLFVASVARFRPGLRPDEIRGFEAATFIGATALKLGLVDELGTFETALARLSSKRPASSPSRISAESSGASSMSSPAANPPAVEAPSSFGAISTGFWTGRQQLGGAPKPAQSGSGRNQPVQAPAAAGPDLNEIYARRSQKAR